MTLKTTRAVLLASAALFSTPAFAQSSAEEIANEIIALGESQGMNIEVGSRVQSGDTLRLNDITYSFAQDGASGEMKVDWLQFQEDGQSVKMTFAPTITGTMVPKNDQGKMAINVTNDGLVYTMAGTPDARSYDITGDQMSISVKMLDGPPELQDLDMTFDLNGLSGDALLAGGVSGTVDMDLNVASANLKYIIDAEEMNANFVSDMSDLVMSYKGDQMTAESATQLFSGERGLAMVMSMGLNTFTGDFAAPGTPPMNISGQAGTALVNVALGNGGLNYDVTGTDLAYNIASAALPIPPVDLRMGEYGMRFAMPIGKVGTTGDLGIRMTLRDLTVSEALWAMVDPGGVLPRDPATLNIDVSGKATTKADFSNPEAMAQLGGAPIDVHDVAITDITLSVAGAELLASGAATLDNSGPIPVPTGKLNASLRGANGLIENLMKLGLLQPQQAMPARMMMGMFAVPGDGPDHLTSEIEFKSNGGILANGIPIK